jgi:hypothetical protein
LKLLTGGKNVFRIISSVFPPLNSPRKIQNARLVSSRALLSFVNGHYLETEADRELGAALEDISRESSFWGKIVG